MITIEQIFKSLEYMAEKMMSNLYWLDLNGKIMGMNQKTLKAIGAKSLQEVIGKTPYDIYPKEIADDLMQHFNDVLESRADIKRDHVIKDLTTGKLRHYSDIISPIFDDSGKELIGIVGTSIEITAEKEAEELKILNEQLKFENQRLEFENKTKQISAELEEHKKFKKIADQMAHDLGSPLMALSVLTSSCAGIPENQRNMLRESASRIRDIAGSLLNQYKSPEELLDNDTLSHELLVYAALEQVMLDKQYEYHHLAIKFECQHTQESLFSFLKVEATLFKRMVSNLVNNAVESMKGKEGTVILKLDNTSKEVMISVIDQGYGMPQILVDKIINNISFSSGKKNGHGIGFGQIHEVLNQYNGKLSVNSKLDFGTTITLTFPRLPAPNWVIEKITVHPNDIVVILDDDNSIHGAWDLKFSELARINSKIKVIHFKIAEDTIKFINDQLSKENILLLTDYELLKQDLNGFDVIKKVSLKRSILVTSHYLDLDIIKKASTIDTKILPKTLASKIPITMV